jgi:TrmH family RNA methyltransferase
VERGGLTADGLCIAESFHLIDEALRSRRRIAAIVASESAAAEAEQIARGTDIVRVSDAAFRTIAATETSQGVLALVEPLAQDFDQVFGESALAVALDGIQDPGNAGAILRAADAFGATGVVLVKGSVNPYNPKAVRASAGSIFRLPIVSGVPAERLLQSVSDRGITLYAAMPHAENDAARTDFRRSCALIIGSEGRGVSQALAAAAKGVRIPTRSVESLNAAVAAGVLLYEASRQRMS